jgi:alkanesulfonate monooxygenase SsuD/methylene tetrahydromethanopterin reductase-like flavin-dependent oxidoreductase (luciferase family)
MAKLQFGAWIPTYAWSGGQSDATNVKRIRACIEKCEDHGVDVWVIDHLLSAPGLYGNAWLEPLNVLAFAAALTRTVKIATGILVLPVRHPVVLAKEISTLCHLSNNRYVFGVGPGWHAREYEVTGSRIEERGRRTDEIIEAVTLLLTKPNASYQGKYYQFNDVTIDPHDVSATLTAIAFDNSSLRWLEINTLLPTSKGPPSSRTGRHALPASRKYAGFTRRDTIASSLLYISYLCESAEHSAR